MKDKDFDKLWNSGATAREYRQCPISDHELETIIGNAIERDSKTRKKHFPVWQKPYVYLAMVAACVAAVVVGLWQVGGNLMFVAPASDALQSSTSLLATQTTDMPTTPILQHTDSKPAAITNNDIKNKITDVLHSESSVQHPDTIAAPPTMAPQPLLLAEAEPETKPEPNYNDNNYTDYLIADASIEIERQLTELQIYCSTRCSDKQVAETIEKTLI